MIHTFTGQTDAFACEPFQICSPRVSRKHFVAYWDADMCRSACILHGLSLYLAVATQHADAWVGWVAYMANKLHMAVVRTHCHGQPTVPQERTGTCSS